MEGRAFPLFNCLVKFRFVNLYLFRTAEIVSYLAKTVQPRSATVDLHWRNSSASAAQRRDQDILKNFRIVSCKWG